METSERELRAMVRAVDEAHREGMATVADDIAELHHGEGSRIMGPPASSSPEASVWAGPPSPSAPR